MHGATRAIHQSTTIIWWCAVCPKAHVQPCTPETCVPERKWHFSQTVPHVTLQPGTARAFVGMDMHGTGCVAQNVPMPMQAWLSLSPDWPA